MTINPVNTKRHRVLICVTGLSPQIVTETLYALCVTNNPPWVPDEVCLITTVKGAEKAKRMLLTEPHAWFPRLLKDWELPPIAFDANGSLKYRVSQLAPSA